MILKYSIQTENKDITARIKILINQIYKLLPSREQGTDWTKPLGTIIQQLAGLYSLMNNSYPQVFIPLFSKLEGLYSLTQEEDFQLYRRTIFECLSFMNILDNELCHQKN